MKVNIEQNEWYPVWCLDLDCDPLFGALDLWDVPDGVVERYKRVMAEFDEMQRVIRRGVVDNEWPRVSPRDSTDTR